jgi:hypothetical protein
MRIKAHCTFWTVEWTKRIDAIGRRYKDVAPVWIEKDRKAVEEMWKAMGFEEVAPDVCVNGDASTAITRQADKEIEYEIHKETV